MNENIKKAFDLYSNKTESDYWIVGLDGSKIPTQSTILTQEDSNKVTIDNENGYPLYKKEFVDEQIGRAHV